jgi:hypothetical protein
VSVRAVIGALALVWIFASPATAAESGITIAQGSGSFTFVDERGHASRPLTVYTYLPEGLKPDAARIVFVMHGVSKNASGHRNVWIEPADRYRFLVIAPRFDAENWGRGAYSYSSVVGRDGTRYDPSLWSYSVIEHLFDALKQATGNTSERYFIYGHSEGGQFVHRLVLFLPDARYAKAVAANPGWYTMPTFAAAFPYGLGNSPATESSLGKSLGRDFVLLLGDRDNDPNHRSLRRTPQAMAQGKTRFERGHSYMNEARMRAAELKTPLRWDMQVVPGAAHQNSAMSRAAAAVLMDQ